MPSPERIITIANPNQDAVMGINHSNPGMLSESYWRDLLQWQIDSNGERQLSLWIVHPDKKVKLKTLSFMDIRKQVQGLPENERDNLLFGIIEQIRQSNQVLLIETNEEKYTPITNNPPHAEKGVILYEIMFRKPSDHLVETIINAQTKLPNRVIFAEWKGEDGKTVATSTIPLNRARTTKERQALSIELRYADRLTVQEISPF